jgi:hypothetical protein
VRRGWHQVSVCVVFYSDFFCQEFWRVKNFGKPVAYVARKVQYGTGKYGELYPGGYKLQLG